MIETEMSKAANICSIVWEYLTRVQYFDHRLLPNFEIKF